MSAAEIPCSNALKYKTSLLGGEVCLDRGHRVRDSVFFMLINNHDCRDRIHPVRYFPIQASCTLHPPSLPCRCLYGSSVITKVYFRFVGIPFPNLLPTKPLHSSLAKLVPTPLKSYKMVFQNVTPLPYFYNMMFMEIPTLAPLPCYYGERAGVRGISPPPRILTSPHMRKLRKLHFRICRICSIFRRLGISLPQTRHQNLRITTATTASF